MQVRWWAVAVRRHSLAVLRSCARYCECLCAFKLHRAHQAYTRLWSAPHSRALLRALHTRTTLMLGATGFALFDFDWQTNRIPLTSLTRHFADVDHVKELTRRTLTCNKCGQRIIVDYPVPEIDYCNCRSSCVVTQSDNETWVPFLERKDLLVWRRERSGNPGLFEYKLFGFYPEVSSDIFLQVQVDAEFRREWDSTAVDVRVIDMDPSVAHSHVLYWEMQWPRLFANRDYVFARRYVIDHEQCVIVIRSDAIEHPAVPEHRDKVRVKDYSCTMVIKPLTKFEETGVEFCMTYFDNPGVNLPQTIQTWVATSAMPEFLSRLRKAAVDFQQKRRAAEERSGNLAPNLNTSPAPSTAPTPNVISTLLHDVNVS